jgi:hypothetical protein
MTKKLVVLTAMVWALSSMVWAGGAGSWTGTVSDSHCGAKHAEAGEKAAGCVAGCVKGGAKYVLVSEGKVYDLDAQDKFADYAGKSVKVSGELDGTTIKVASVEAAK